MWLERGEGGMVGGGEMEPREGQERSEIPEGLMRLPDHAEDSGFYTA